MPFSFREASLPGILIVEPRLFPDERGSFMESYKASDFDRAGIAGPFVQDNHSISSRGTVRGLHFQRGAAAQGKLVRVIRGRAWDVAVDLRRSSPTFGKWYGLELSAENRLQFWIPEGFAHGFVALEEGTELQYKCTAEYAPMAEGGIRWDDPTLGIHWPLDGVSLMGTVTDKRGTAPSLVGTVIKGPLAGTVSERDSRLPAFDPQAEYFP